MLKVGDSLVTMRGKQPETGESIGDLAGFASTAEQWTIPHLRALVDSRLADLIPRKDVAPQMLHAAMAYNLLAPGKRLRPLLTMLISLHFGRRDLVALDVACAIEMVHTASLVMDDLPAMDDAMFRRGQPTAHREFGEDIAILAGVALLNQAFVLLATSAELSAEIRIDLVRLIASAVGSDGLIGGQVMDLRLRSGTTDDGELRKLNEMKTAALFTAAAEAGARLAGIKGDMLDTVRQFALELGTAFQIADDLLDDPVYAGQTGKDTGKDVNKPTILSKVGKADARRMLDLHLVAARQCLDRMGSDDQRLASLLDQGFFQFRS